MSRILKLFALCIVPAVAASACSDPAASISAAGSTASLECGGYLGSGNVAPCP
ncbi:MAG TPA: hypothetical protein VHG93_19165 [Longimicrobium sp.]|nr:hypothetical protein [Longimicrobium sp.]